MMQRGKNQVLFKYLPGKPIDYNQGNAIALVERWFSSKVTDVNKSRLIREIYNSIRPYGTNIRGFPVILNPDHFELLTPIFVEAELFPLTFICDDCGRAYSFGSVQQLNRILKKHRCNCGGSVTQMDLVYYHECGHLWGPRIPKCETHGYEKILLNKHRSNSPRDWRWDCGICGREITNLNNWCPACNEPGSQVYPTPFRQSSVFTPHSLTLVNLQNFDENRLNEDEIFKKLKIAEYLNILKKHDCSFEECLEVSSKEDNKLDTFISDLKSRGMSEKMINEILESLNKTNPNKKQVRNAILSEVDSIIHPPQGDTTSVASKVYEFMETLRTSSAIHLDLIVKNAEETNRPNFEKIKMFPAIMETIGVKNAYVLNNLSIVKLVYGFTRGSTSNENKVLNRFSQDKSTTQNKVPIYLNKSNTEAMLLELDRWKILKWLQENGIVTKIPERNDETALKAWFLNNVNQDKITPFREIENEELVTKMIFRLLHSISHSLITTGSVECGLDKNSLAELIFPSIPIIIIYCSNSQEFQIGGMFTLFENNIYPWIEKTIEKVNNCIYDPLCMDHQSACHSCLYLSEFSCVHFNHDLGRDVLIGKTTNNQKMTGFWSREFLAKVLN